MSESLNNGYEVLLYISDQHTASMCGCMGDKIVRTPNIDRISEDSFIFDRAYTSCPLCVPARASLMTGRIPSNIGVFGNGSDYRSSEVTFVHMHALSGYDTNLIGRMHFMGMDYFHGFTRRIGTDLSNNYWGYNPVIREDWGDFKRTLAQTRCLEVIGSGDSPVLEYDKEVVKNALEFLSKDYDKPQLTVVGTYSPHFPYYGDKEKMDYYREVIRKDFKRDTFEPDGSPVKAKMQELCDDDLIEVRAAYYAMIEQMDEQIGMVYNAFQDYLKRNSKKGIFIYMSDHGDMLGYKDMYGKQTFFEQSAKIPVIMKIDGIKGKRTDAPISIIDIAPTLCELDGTEQIPVCDGKSFAGIFKGTEQANDYVISEFYDNYMNKPLSGFMVYKNDYKLITYRGYEQFDMLFNLKDDPDEKVNIAKTDKMMYNELMSTINSDDRYTDATKLFVECNRKYKVLSKFGADKPQLNGYTYFVPEYCRKVEEKYKRPNR